MRTILAAYVLMERALIVYVEFGVMLFTRLICPAVDIRRPVSGVDHDSTAPHNRGLS